MKGAADLKAIQTELRPSELRAIREWCAIREIPVEDWPSQTRLGAFLDLAVDRYLGRLPTAWPDRRKLQDVAGHFGLRFAGLRKRYQRDGTVPGRKRFVAGGVVDLAAERAASRERQRKAS